LRERRLLGWVSAGQTVLSHSPLLCSTEEAAVAESDIAFAAEVERSVAAKARDERQVIGIASDAHRLGRGVGNVEPVLRPRTESASRLDTARDSYASKLNWS
jgi:hypothetical protein